MIPLPIASYNEPPHVTARLVNVLAEQNPIDAKAPVRITRAPRVTAYKTLGDGPGRGLHVMGGALYAVSGDALWAVASQTELGTIPGTGRVRMADTDTKLVVVTNPDAYEYSGTVSQITDPDFDGAGTVDFVDWFFVFVEPASGEFFCSDLYSTAFDALKFVTAEGAPDDLVDLIVDHREVILFGEDPVGRTVVEQRGGQFPL